MSIDIMKLTTLERYDAIIKCIYGKGDDKVTSFINRVGQTFNNLQIMQELGSAKVLAKCSLCGSLKEYRKNNIVLGLTLSCGCAKARNKHKLIDRTNQIFNNLEIIKELGNNAVRAKCLKCSSIKTYSKSNIVSGNTRSCGCVNRHNETTGNGFISRAGQVFRNLKILEDSGCNKVKTQCIECGKINDYQKNNVIARKIDCRHTQMQ